MKEKEPINNLFQQKLRQLNMTARHIQKLVSPELPEVTASAWLKGDRVPAVWTQQLVIWKIIAELKRRKKAAPRDIFAEGSPADE